MTESSPQRIGAQEQFGHQARFYTESLVHSSGESLQVVRDWAARGRYHLAADVGTGTGFTAFAVAPYSDQVLATDITPAMLRETRSLVDQRGLANLSYVLAAAEELPFANGSLDLVTCRTAAHHFLDIPRAMAEWHRVLKPEAVLLLADTSSPEGSEVAAWMNEVELRRDPSHGRDLPPSEWLNLLEANGFLITDTALTPVPMELEEWMRRSGTPAPVAEDLRRDFLNAPAGAVQAFHIHRDHDGGMSFQWSCLVARALRRP